MEGRAGAGTRQKKKKWPGPRSVFSSLLESLKTNKQKTDNLGSSCRDSDLISLDEPGLWNLKNFPVPGDSVCSQAGVTSLAVGENTSGSPDLGKLMDGR